MAVGRPIVGAGNISAAFFSSRQIKATKNCCSVSKPVQEVNVAEILTMADENLDEKWASASKIKIESAGDQFTTGLGRILSRWVEATAYMDETPGSTRKFNSFHSVKVPEMNIQDYFKRIQRYFFCSNECYVVALVYLDRVGKIDPSMTVCAPNVHRLLVIVVMVAAKFHDDLFHSNAYYAKVGGLSLKEVNVLEAKLLTLLGWKTYVEPEEYQLYHNLVCQTISASWLLTPEPWTFAGA